MSMQIAILVFVTCFAAITGWLVSREPADQPLGDSYDQVETVSKGPKTSPSELESVPEKEATPDEVIALSDAERAVRSALNETVIPVMDLENASLEEAIDYLRLQVRENDPPLSLSCIIKHSRTSSTDPLNHELALSDQQPITIYKENINVTKALNLICKRASYRWEITDHGILLTPLD